MIPSNNKIKEKYCADCGKSFICNTVDISACQCSAITLTEQAKEYLSKTYSDCLCIECLTKINMQKPK